MHMQMSEPDPCLLAKAASVKDWLIKAARPTWINANQRRPTTIPPADIACRPPASLATSSS
jgi:hypothetical protein